MVETLVRLPLGEAANAVRKHPSTLTKAANHKDPEKRLPFTLGDDGDRLFSIADLQKRFGKIYSPEEDSLVNSSEKKKKKLVNSSVRGSEKKSDSPSDSLAHMQEIHRVRTSALEREISMLTDNNRRLEGEVDAWKQQADTWRRASEQHLFLLTNQTEKEPDIDLSAPEQSSHSWGRYAAVFLALSLVGSALFYRDNLVHQWAKFTDSSDSTAAAIESQKPQG